MEHCPRRHGAITQLLSYPMPTTSMDWGISQSSSEWRAQVICPQPIRATRPKRLNVRYGQTEMDILDFILNEDDQDGDFDSSNQVGIFGGSPPVRSSNPVIRDVTFGKLNSPMPSPLGGSFGGMTSPRVERGGSSCGSSSSFSSKPQIRIEGFSSGNSDSRCVVSALA